MNTLDLEKYRILSDHDKAMFILKYEMVFKRKFDENIAEKIINQSGMLEFAEAHPSLFFHCSAEQLVDDILDDYCNNTEKAI